jgi:hypothetical protein
MEHIMCFLEVYGERAEEEREGESERRCSAKIAAAEMDTRARQLRLSFIYRWIKQHTHTHFYQKKS